MRTTMAAQLRALQDMTVDQLRTRYREVFGEETRSRHKDFLWKRIAWRIQALEEGDLGERARRRATELANDADIRVRAPRGVLGGSATEVTGRTHVHVVGRIQDERLPMPGTVLTREYKGRTLLVTVLDAGFEFEGRAYRSLTAIAKDVTGSQWNGFLFFGLPTARRATAGGKR